MGSPNIPLKEKNSHISSAANSGTKVPVVKGPASRGPRLGSAPKR